MMLYNYATENWSRLVGGGEISIWRGVRPQRGNGIGGILRRLFQALPAFLSSPLGRTVVDSGKAVVSDVMAGNDVGTSVKTNARQAVKNLTGLGRKKRRSMEQKQVGGLIGYIKPSPVNKTSSKKKRTRRSYVKI